MLVFFLLSAFGAQAQNAYTDAGLPVPTVSSDKDDYSPGEVAIISGFGWKLDGIVDVHFEETPAFHTEHQHDYHNISVDANGNWTIRYQIEERHLGVAFEVHVVGKTTGYEAYAYFTDGQAQIKSIDKTTFSPVKSQSLTITAWNNGVENKGALELGVRIKKGSIEGETVWESTYINLKGGEELIFFWDGKYNLTANSGSFVPNGDYYIIAVKREEKDKKIVYTETIGDPSLYKKVTIINQVQPTIEWTTAGSIIYGTDLSGKLNAVAKYDGATVAGTYVYKQGTTVVTNTTILSYSATAYPLTVEFTPTDASQYFSATGTNSITVNKKAASVAVAPQTKEYGAADPALTGTLAGFLTADNVTASYSRVAGETVAGGPYAITATLSPTSVLGNYEITNTAAALDITKKELTITADAKT